LEKKFKVYFTCLPKNMEKIYIYENKNNINTKEKYKFIERELF